jgi:lysophospholipase L1-like esterase
MTPRIVALAVIALALAGCTSSPAPSHTVHTEPVKVVTPATPQPAPVTFAAAGDSITAWIDRNNNPVPTTWVSFVGRDGILFQGEGWAKGGAKLAEIDANMRPVTADVLVVMAGTNDEGDRWGTPMSERLQEVSEIVEKSQAPHVLISAVAPRDAAPEWAEEWNETLAAYAVRNGWHFVDPWVSVRTLDGHYAPGTTVEGIHPTPATAEIIGHTMVAAIIAAGH